MHGEQAQSNGSVFVPMGSPPRPSKLQIVNDSAALSSSSHSNHYQPSHQPSHQPNGNGNAGLPHSLSANGTASLPPPLTIETELTKQNLYKTELCRNWRETGLCRYGNKCQFAHGGDELRGVLRHPKYKTEICRQYHTTGTCTYGKRCRFVHHCTEMRTPEGEVLQDSNYTFQRQLAQLKYGEVLPSPTPSLFAYPGVSSPAKEIIPPGWMAEVESLMGDVTASTLEPKRPSLGGESTLDGLSGSVSSRFSQSLSPTPSLSPPRALGSPRLSLSPVGSVTSSNGHANGSAMHSPQPAYLAVPDSGEGGDRSDRESNTSRERAHSHSKSLRAAGGSASVSVLAQADLASASSGTTATNTAATNATQTERDPTSHSYGLESYESNDEGLCISFTSTEEESDAEGGAGERAARKKSKLSFFQKLHKHKKRT